MASEASLAGEPRSNIKALDLCVGVISLLIFSFSLALSFNHAQRRPLKLFAALPSHKPGDVRMIEMRRLVGTEDVLIIDARGSKAFDRGHLPGALNLGLAEFPERYEQLKANLGTRQMVVYCSTASCSVADRLKSRLEDNGHDSIRIFRAGYTAWVADGLSVELANGTGR